MFQHLGQEVLPPLWSRIPGDIGTLAVVGNSNSMSQKLPPSWSVEHLWEWSRITAIEEPFTAVIVDPRGAATRQVEERIDWLTQQAFLRDAQILLIDSSHTAELLGLPRVRALSQDCRPLARKIHEEVGWSLKVWLKRQLARLLGDAPQVNQFLRRSLLQYIPGLVDVVESDTVAGITYVRKVKDVAEVLNWSRSYLYQHLPFRASDALRAFAFIHGLLLFSPGVTSWSVVATRLGFYDAGNWSHFCKRVVGVSPTELCDRTRGEWISQALDTGFGQEARARGRLAGQRRSYYDMG